MAASTDFVKNVAIVGATGNVGSYITSSLLATGKHNVTAITRKPSDDIPKGVETKIVDYDKHETLVTALRGQDALVISLAGTAPKDTELNLVNAAGEAGVKWIFPNEWSPDTAHQGLLDDLFIFPPKQQMRETIEKLGKSSHLSVCTGFWYEWSLAIEPAFGFDFAKKKVTFFDDGSVKMSISTWPQVGRAVAALLSLPINPSSSSKACINDFRNKVIYVNSFTVSQRDMFESALRVTKTKESDWDVSYEPAKERFETAQKGIKEGNRMAFAKWLYTRVFFDDGCGDFEKRLGTSNHVLGLPKEDIDEATGRAIQRSAEVDWTHG